jgi:HlyD family secretion protein
MSHPRKPIDTQRSLRAYQILGFVVLLLLVVGVGGWGALAPINGAVIVPATVAVESYTKKVQHREGGIVSEIRVKEGDDVKAGEVLAVLSDTDTKADLAIILGQLDEVMANRARLEAERDDAAAPVFPPELLARADDPKLAKILDGQRKLLLAETASLKGQKDQLQQRAAQLAEEIRGLEAQLESNEKQTKLINEELKAFKGLVAKGLIEVTRVREREGAAANLEGERGQIIASIAQAQEKISEIQLQIIQLQDDARAKVLTDLSDAETKMTELTERRDAAQSRLSRTTIRAPVAGYVYHMAVHTIGGVVGPGETILEIVPQFDDLVLAGRARPQDIDKIQMGQTALVRFPEFNRRTTPEIMATVTYVAADVTQPVLAGRDGISPYYELRLTIDAKERAKLEGKALKPGMPAEAFLQTGARIALSYFLKPLTDQFAHTFKEE